MLLRHGRFCRQIPYKKFKLCDWNVPGSLGIEAILCKMFIDMNGMVLSLAEKEDGTTKRSYQTTVAIEGTLDSPLTTGLMSWGSQIFFWSNPSICDKDSKISWSGREEAQHWGAPTWPWAHHLLTPSSLLLPSESPGSIQASGWSSPVPSDLTSLTIDTVFLFFWS